MPIVIVLVIGLSVVLYVNNSQELIQSALDDSEHPSINQTEPKENNSSTTTDSVKPQQYRVDELLLEPKLAPLGEPISVTARLTKISGIDPHPVELHVSGTHYETKYVSFGESDTAEIEFTITMDTHGIHEAHIMDFRDSFEVHQMPVEVEWITVSPRFAELGSNITFSFSVVNPNNVPVEDQVYVVSIPELFHYSVQVPPLDRAIFSFNLTKEHAGNYTIEIGEKKETFTVLEERMEEPQEKEFIWTPIEWEPDPLTWNMTSKLPPTASPLRLSMPVPIDSLYGARWAGIGGMGLHSGGHIEGLDHVWIESTTTEPVKSWADGTVIQIQLSGDIEQGEYHIIVDYGYNLTGIHMEVETPLVEVGDEVKRGDPIGYGMVFFDDLQSAEMTLIDHGRTDGIYSGDGVMVSPFDYLEESERITLADAYIKNIIEPYMETGTFNGMFTPEEPYFTNWLLIHREPGTLQGEWYLISQNWSAEYPNDLITVIEADNPYHKGAKILGNDDESSGASGWKFRSVLEIDYEKGRITWLDWNEKRLYGIFEVDESEDRAKLRIQYQKGSYPSEFTDAALTYIERSYIGRRQEAVQLGVLTP